MRGSHRHVQRSDREPWAANEAYSMAKHAVIGYLPVASRCDKMGEIVGRSAAHAAIGWPALDMPPALAPPLRWVRQSVGRLSDTSSRPATNAPDVHGLLLQILADLSKGERRHEAVF